MIEPRHPRRHYRQHPRLSPLVDLFAQTASCGPLRIVSLGQFRVIAPPPTPHGCTFLFMLTAHLQTKKPLRQTSIDRCDRGLLYADNKACENRTHKQLLQVTCLVYFHSFFFFCGPCGLQATCNIISLLFRH